jgi:GxxExxY protein
MNKDGKSLEHGQLTDRVTGVFYAVYNELGTGFVESVYENAMAMALTQAGLQVTQQAGLEVRFRNQLVGSFRADLVVADSLIVELKAVTALLPAHEVQLVNYLKASGIPVGLLLNFGLRPQVRRKIFTHPVSDPPLSDVIRV